LRQIAATAGADKRLITRYFGSKERLFAVALRASTSKFAKVSDDRLGITQRFAESIFGSELTDADRLEFISLCVHSAASANGKRLVRSHVKQQIKLIAERFGGEYAAPRAALFLVVCFGTALVREILRIEELTNLSVESAVRLIAPMLHPLIDPPRSLTAQAVKK
jgi:AcrR family transcriptional regulator